MSVVHTNLSRGDVVIGSIAMMFASPQNRWMLVGMAVVCSYLVSEGAAEFVMTAVILTMVGFGGGAIFAIANAFFNPKLARGVLGDHKFTVTDEGLWEETEFNKTLHKWPALDRITKMFGMVMIRVAGSTWHILPLRSFAHEAEAQGFIAALKQRAAGASAPSSPSSP